MLNAELQGFKEMSKHPTWILLYKIKWAQLADVIKLKNLNILDFGSGFGTTANFLAKENIVTAIEPRADMIEMREQENQYTQINGKIEKVRDFPDSTFDVVICHNVLEFALERAEIVKELSRVLKNGGILSIIKNNGVGRIISKAVSNEVDVAMDLLESGHIANVFGTVELYEAAELVVWGNKLEIIKLLGVQTFYGLQQNKYVNEPDWIDKTFALEMKVADLEPYKSFALFHHVLLRKG